MAKTDGIQGMLSLEKRKKNFFFKEMLKRTCTLLLIIPGATPGKSQCGGKNQKTLCLDFFLSSLATSSFFISGPFLSVNVMNSQN